MTLYKSPDWLRRAAQQLLLLVHYKYNTDYIPRLFAIMSLASVTSYASNPVTSVLSRRFLSPEIRIAVASVSEIRYRY